ncbi:unnamed protein product [Rotaria sordida]|nr:unnamed protein product [Rotaria sordida]
MDYPAPTSSLYQVGRNLSTWGKVMEIKNFIGHAIEMIVDFPLYILDKLGISFNFLQINPALCSVCVCGALVGMTASVGVGVGVGLGVGLNCAKSATVDILTTTTEAISIAGSNITNTTASI